MSLSRYFVIHIRLWLQIYAYFVFHAKCLHRGLSFRKDVWTIYFAGFGPKGNKNFQNVY